MTESQEPIRIDCGRQLFVDDFLVEETNLHRYLYTSPDGIHWAQRVRTGPCGDNTAMFRNPFRKVWAYSIRTFGTEGRLRSYHEHPDFISGAQWSEPDVSGGWQLIRATGLILSLNSAQSSTRLNVSHTRAS